MNITERNSVGYTSSIDATKEYNFLLNENRELKENNNKLFEKKEELERKLKFLNSSKEKEEILSIKGIIYTKEMAFRSAQDKLKILEEESEILQWKIDALEKINKSELNLEDFLKSKEIDLMKLFNDIVIKNMDKKDQYKMNNKMLLENFINLGKEYKQLQLKGSIKK